MIICYSTDFQKPIFTDQWDDRHTRRVCYAGVVCRLTLTDLDKQGG